MPETPALTLDDALRIALYIRDDVFSEKPLPTPKEALEIMNGELQKLNSERGYRERIWPTGVRARDLLAAEVEGRKLYSAKEFGTYCSICNTHDQWCEHLQPPQG